MSLNSNKIDCRFAPDGARFKFRIGIYRPVIPDGVKTLINEIET